MQICAVCNDAQIVFDAEEGTYGRIGEPTEAALSVLVEKLGVPGAFVGDNEPAKPSKMHLKHSQSHVPLVFPKLGLRCTCGSSCLGWLICP